MEGLKLLAGLFLLFTASLWSAEKPVTAFPPPADSADWTRLLEKYVDARGLVAYASWKGSPNDSSRLDAYLARFSMARVGPSTPKKGEPTLDEKVAALINAYNAFIIRTVLDRYPIDGIRSISGAFTSETHGFGGRKCSLDEIEHSAVRLGGYRVHAAIVCASRSCPPLDRRAYEAATLSAREDERMRAWISRSDLYRFEPERNVANLPKYFDWYRSDFEKAGIPAILSTYAPERYRNWLAAGRFRVEFLDYDWSLNDRKGP